MSKKAKKREKKRTKRRRAMLRATAMQHANQQAAQLLNQYAEPHMTIKFMYEGKMYEGFVPCVGEVGV